MLSVNAMGMRAGPAFRRTPSAQMSLGLNGAFWPTILPLFHGS